MRRPVARLLIVTTLVILIVFAMWYQGLLPFISQKPSDEHEEVPSIVSQTPSSEQEETGEHEEVLPKFCVHDVTDLDMIAAISKFRSMIGHDYSDSFEMERSMKHYYMPLPEYLGTIDKLPLYSPVKGKISGISEDATAGYLMRIQVEGYEDFYICIHHINVLSNITQGVEVNPGDLLGFAYLIGTSCFDIAVFRLLDKKFKYYSIFEFMSDDVFARYKAKGIESQNVMIISREDADKSPFLFSSPNPYDWVYLHHGPYEIGNSYTVSQSAVQYFNYSSIGQWDGNFGFAADSYVSNNILYVACKAGGLLVANISDPTTPKILGWYADGGISYAVYVIGRYAYVADGPDGLEIIDVSDPIKPKKVSSISIGDYACDVFIKDNYAYVAYHSNGLVIFNISDPESPVVVGSYYDGGTATGVFVAGSYAYVADGPDDLEIIDVSNPENPVEVGQYCDRLGWARKVIISGHYAYVADDWRGLEIIDISDPKRPYKVGEFSDFVGTIRLAYDVFMRDDIVFLADNYAGVHVINVSVPSAPSYITTYHYGGSSGVYVTNNNYLVICTIPGIRIINVTNVYSAKLLSSIDITGYGINIQVDGACAYLADGLGGLKIINISDPHNPVILGTFKLHDCNFITDCIKHEDLVYVASFRDGLIILNVSYPSSPYQVGTYHLNYCYRIFVSGSYCFVADYAEGLKIIDVSDPREPFVVGSFYDGGVALGVYVVGNYAYVADGPDGLEIIDVGDPTNPKKVGSFYDGGYAFDIFVADGIAYVADGWGNLEILNVSDPTNPVKVGEYDTEGYAYKVLVNGSYAYVAEGYNGLEVINVSDPANPIRVGIYCDREDIQGVYVYQSYVYIAEGWGGLKILYEKTST